MTEGAHAIDALLLEERRYPPPPEFAAQANAQPDIYERDFDEFWETEGRERVTWFEPFTKLYEWEPPYAKWYLGGKLNVCFNCVDRHVEAGTRRQGRLPLGGRARGRAADDHVRRPPARGRALRQRPEGARRRQGHAGRDLHGDDPGAAGGSMLACARLGAPHTVVFGGFSADALSDRLNDMECEVLITQDAGWRKGGEVPLKRNADEALDRSPGVRTSVVWRRVGGRRRDARGPRRLGARARRGPERRPGDVPVRADGLGGPPLPPLHERHDREAEGDRPHDRRLPRRRRDDAPLHLRREARLGLLVRGRHRLGHRAQLHRLRAARERDRPASSTRASPTIPTASAGGRSSSATRSTSSTRRRRRSGRT